MKNRLLLATLILGIAGLLVCSGTGQAPQKPRTALLVWGGWEGHEPKPCVDIFAPWLESQGFKVEISHSLDAYLDLDKLKKFRVLHRVNLVQSHHHGGHFHLVSQ